MRSLIVFQLLLAALSCSVFAAIRPGKPTLGSVQNLHSSDAWFHHNAGLRINTDAVIFQALTEEHPESYIAIVHADNCNVFSYSDAGLANSTLLKASASIATHKWRVYVPPPNRIEGDDGTVVDVVKFGVYRYVWKSTELLVYLVDTRDGDQAYSALSMQYIVGPREVVENLIAVVGRWNSTLHSEIWVFDQAFWQKDEQLYRDVQQASWDKVILAQEMKDALVENAQRFFDSREDYAHLGVPWKRGLIFHGPPGNGKTISIKATMHMLYNRTTPIPTLYVRTLSGFGEWALKPIFDKAREQAPCYLVFEDLDSLVTPQVRSYFLNQIDGIQPNDGILMVGSTNHIELLDPGIAKRPSRFDRKFFFPNPSLEQRVQYCEFWRHKLESNKELEFTEELVRAVANITEDFSFAYIQEAFVASLLEIANEGEKEAMKWAGEDASIWDVVPEQVTMGKNKKLEDLLLWRVIRKQIRILREELETESAACAQVDDVRDSLPETSQDLKSWTNPNWYR